MARVEERRTVVLQEPLAQSLGLRLGQTGQRRHAPEEVVVMRYLFDTLGRDSTAAEDVRKKRSDVSWSLWAAESDQQYCIERSASRTAPR